MKLFVWDFHGVLEKGNDGVVAEITNLILDRHGHSRRMTMEESVSLSGKRWHEYFAHLLPHHDHEEHLKLQSDCVEMSLNNPGMIARHIRLNDHAGHVLEKIHQSPHTQILISNTQPASLDIFVQLVGVEKYFASSHRFGVDSHSSRKLTKKDCLDAFLQGRDYKDGMIAIGDSPGDVEWVHTFPKGVGYLYAHPDRSHREAKCHYRIRDLRDILQEV